MREILINLTMLGNKAKGIARYAKEIITRCEQIPEYKKLPITYLFAKNNYSAWNSIRTGKCIYKPNIFTVDKGGIYGLIRYLVPPTIVPNLNYIFNPSYQGCLFNNNQILTILDVIPLKNPNQRKFQYIAFKYLLPILLKKAIFIITISESTKKAILDNYDVDEKKIIVIYCAVDNNKFYYDSKIKKSNTLLVVGAHLEHKNIHELLEHHQLWKNDYTLEIIAAESPYLMKLRNIVEKYNLKHKVNFLSDVDDETLILKYRQAHALVYPSLDEGFGIPLLEAMNVGTSVVASDIPVHREVCSNAAIYITPGKIETWEKAFDCLRKDHIIKEYTTRGFDQAKQFSWDRSAHQLTNLLRSIYIQK
jgi:glycosyltransferase involved in cell wall biosynthesis